jgi:hypothetical protein
MDAVARWRQFVDSVIVTYVTGEEPSVTDSGFTFARKARKVLRIPESRVLSPLDTLRELLKTRRPVVFVDDFVGSGNQFVDTWHREYRLFGSTSLAFSHLAGLPGFSFAYCPLVCTDGGARQLSTRCAGLTLRPAHLLPAVYSAIHPQSIVWPPNLLQSGPEFVKAVSARIGIPDSGGAVVNDWQGFHCLGLSLAFYDSVPDATLPIFYWEENGWNPLIKKT